VEIGDRVRTKHGAGVIVSKDLPDFKCWRWCVQIDGGRIRCYFPKNVKPVERRC